MESFLKFCHDSLNQLPNYQTLELVIGNEACDLDSAVSALVFAYIRHHELVEIHENSKNVLAIPVMNCLRADLKLRREIVFWFENVLQFPLCNFICRDEIDFNLLNMVSVTVSLVDHNENRDIFRRIPNAHLGHIIDHHKPTSDGKCQSENSDLILIDPSVGSCCTLVAFKYFSCVLSSRFEHSNRTIASDSQIALLLYGPILLDTICFNPTAKRFSAQDHEAINKIEELLKHSEEAETSLFDRNDVYQRLSEAKESLDGLSFEELLRKDMKIVEAKNMTICISSITGILLTDMSLKDKTDEFKLFSENPPDAAIFTEHNLRLFNSLILLSVDSRIPNNLRRQLAIFCTNKHLMRAIATCLEKSELELELISAFDTLRIYNQNNLQATRKTVLPIISKTLNGPEHLKNTEYPNVVDPDYLINFMPKTISVPEFEVFIRQHNETLNDNRLTSDNVKRNDSGEVLNISGSAPSSFIQAPDGSTYGSFIADSYVGDFVGEYDIGEPTSEPDNLFTLDPEGQLIMNPPESSYNSHSHEIEFDFDSFGPESMIYSSNDNSNVKSSELENVLELSDNSEKIEGKSFEDEGLRVTPISDIPTIQISDVENDSTRSSEITHDDSGNSSIADTTAGSNHLSSTKDYETAIPEHAKTEPSGDFTNVELNNIDEQKIEPEISSFSRNSTLTRSQRKKVLPQVTIKNLLMTSETYSPPVLDSVIPISLTDSSLKPISPLVSYSQETKDNENFIRSTTKSDESYDHSDKTEHDITSGGLTRQPSMKRKVPVNYNILLENNFEKEETLQESENKDLLNSGNDTFGSDSTPDKVSVMQVGDVSVQGQFDSFLRNEQEGIFEQIDMKVIEPYKKVLSHGGYMDTGIDGRHEDGSSSAIIIFSACYLPERSRKDYNYVMENLFSYVLNTLHNMVGNDYILIYLHNGGSGQSPEGSSVSGNNMPTFNWLKKCYQMIDRKLKKNLKGLYLVHPTFWLKTLIIMTKPFISTKFSKKLKFVNSLEELCEMIPIQHVAFPSSVVS